MKRVSNIYYKVYDIDNISKMCDLVCSKVRNKEKAEKFMLYKTEHIINIRNKLISKNLREEIAKELGVYDQVKQDGGSWANVSSKNCGNIVKKAIEIANRSVENK